MYLFLKFILNYLFLNHCLNHSISALDLATPIISRWMTMLPSLPPRSLRRKTRTSTLPPWQQLQQCNQQDSNNSTQSLALQFKHQSYPEHSGSFYPYICKLRRSNHNAWVAGLLESHLLRNHSSLESFQTPKPISNFPLFPRLATWPIMSKWLIIWIRNI